MRLALSALVTGLFAASLPASAEIEHDALVAGYKAAFTCSATFNAGQTLGEIEANELTGIYPDYRETMAALPPAEIDERNKVVSVRYSLTAAPRLAAWRPGFGCSQLPLGADLSEAHHLPHFVNASTSNTPDRATTIGANASVTFPVLIAERLEAPIAFAFDGQTYGEDTRTSAVLIVRNGEIVAEQYARGIDAETPQRTWSVAKSITTTVLGAAAGDSIIGPESSALLEAWSQGADPRRKITLANLLHMASGLESGEKGSRTDAVYFGGAAVADQAVTSQIEAVPGTRYKYANNDTLAAMRALREAIGDDQVFHNYPYREVLYKIGATHTVMETDWNGDFIASSQVWSTARDLARIGELYLNNGRWGDEQILHPEWVRFVTTPAPAQPEDNDFGYGAGFWLLPNDPGVPYDAFAAMGHRGQMLVIIPSEGLVIVRRGYDYSGSGYFDIAGFTRDVVSAIHAAEAQRLAEEEAARLAEAANQPQELTAEERRERRERPLNQRSRPFETN